MKDILKTNFFGVNMPNPFMVASGPPSNTARQAIMALQTGWGGIVWKTIGVSVKNVCPRYAAIFDSNGDILGMNNIELISDRPLAENLEEIRSVKKEFPDRAVFVSIMSVYDKTDWQDLAKAVEDTGCDAIELNLSCPHGLPEKGLGSVYGQDPNLTSEVTMWVKEAVKIPILVKLTPNVSDILPIARAASDAGADGISLINTINSIIGVDLNDFVPYPKVNDKSTSGGYCNRAIKPIALYHLSRIAKDNVLRQKVKISAMGGIRTWQDAAEFMTLGADTIQVCSAIMESGYGIASVLARGLAIYLRNKGFSSISDIVGKAIMNLTSFDGLDKNYRLVSEIDKKKCIGCDKCYIACNEGCYGSIIKTQVKRHNEYEVDENKCVGCGMCQIVCPVRGCIMMREIF